MSYGVIKSLETLRANCRSTNPLDCVTTHIYRAFNHKIDIKEHYQSNKNKYFISVYSKLLEFFNRIHPLSEQGTSTHILKAIYRTFAHIFTVLSPTFLPQKPRPFSYINIATQEVGQLESANSVRTTALSPIKLPFFHTCTYRTSTQSSTALSNMNFTNITVLSTIKSLSNLLIRFTNSIRKVDLKLDHKKIISLVDVLFFEFGRGRKQI